MNWIEGTSLWGLSSCIRCKYPTEIKLNWIGEGFLSDRDRYLSNWPTRGSNYEFL